MQPVLSAQEMRAVDAAALEAVPFEQLVARAGHQVARHALAMLGGAYGRRVVVVAGRGHNGDDGRVAAELLRRRGVRVRVLPASDAPDRLPACDLVIDAAYGTGFHGDYVAPTPPAGARVLAVDIPSGVEADTAVAGERAVFADATVTFGALKPALLLAQGRARSGTVSVERIGLPVAGASMFAIEDEDVTRFVPPRPVEAHKWQHACFVVAGSPGMTGAAVMAARAAQRAGAGMVRLATPGAPLSALPVLEAVMRELPATQFARPLLSELRRCRALVLGPGLGTGEEVASAVRTVLEEADVPIVLDADGLNVLGEIPAGGLSLRGQAPLVLTPHDGEFKRLAGVAPGNDRVAAVRALARRAGAVVLLKGATTLVGEPAGRCYVVTSGGPRLASAGTGDVLAGVIGAFLARGIEPGLAAALAAHVHGRAAALGPAEGLVAGDLPPSLATVLSRLVRPARAPHRAPADPGRPSVA